MALWQNTVENGLADGTPITATNSDDGDAGNPITGTLRTTTASTITVTTADPISGTRSLLFANASAESAAIEIAGYAVRTMSVACEFDCADLAVAPSATARLVEVRGSSTVGVRLLFTTGRTLIVQTMAGTTIYTSAVLPTTGKLTVNLACDAGTTTSNGTAGFAYYLGSNTNPAETAYAGTGLNVGAADLTAARFGKPATTTWTTPLRGDNFRVSDGTTTLLGPSPTVAVPLAASLSVAPASGTAPLAVTATATATGGTGSAKTYSFQWGDGATTPTQASASATHTYSTAGTYTVTVTVANT